MNTSIPYGVAFAGVALVTWRCGYRREAEGVGTMAAAFAAFAPWVAWSAFWPLAGMTIWAAVSLRLHYLANRGFFPYVIPWIGYAMTSGYVAYLADSPFTLPPLFAYWQTWILNAMGLIMAALILRRPACDGFNHIARRGVGRDGGSTPLRNERLAGGRRGRVGDR